MDEALHVTDGIEASQEVVAAGFLFVDGKGGGASAGLLKVIKAGMGDSDVKLREASYIAYSASNATSADAIALVFSAKAPDAGSNASEESADTEDDLDSLEEDASEEEELDDPDEDLEDF